MAIQEMNGKKNSSCEIDKMLQVFISNESKHSKPTTFINDSHVVGLVKELQSLRKDNFLCDIKLITDDGSIVVGHKHVLAAASPYFRVMFSSLDTININKVNLSELDSNVLELLVDYIYTGEISVTKENVQVLLPAAKILLLDYVSSVCDGFMKSQINPSNCLGIKSFAKLHNCKELLSSSEVYIKKHFVEVTECEEFLSLSFEELTELISCNDINVPSEEKVFECVIKWVKHELGCRKDLLPKLMEHVRLPLVSGQFILNNIGEEPLLKNSLQCQHNIIEALRHIYIHKNKEQLTIPGMVLTKSRQSCSFQKVILAFGKKWNKSYVKFYDPTNKLLRTASEMRKIRYSAGLALIRDRYVFAVGGVFYSNSRSVEMLDIASQSPNWVPTTDMISSRKYVAVGVLNDCIYAVGGSDGSTTLNTAEVFDLSKWSMMSSMSTKRMNFGVGVLDNRLYAVGGWDGSKGLKSVECYDPTFNSWTPVAEMSVPRQGVGVAVLNGVLYAIGGNDGVSYLRSAETFRPSDGVWSLIADMHVSRTRSGVVALDGLLYVMGGRKGYTHLDSIEMYNPDTNTWSIEPLSTKGNLIYGGVVVKDH